MLFSNHNMYIGYHMNGEVISVISIYAWKTAALIELIFVEQQNELKWLNRFGAVHQ